MADLGCIERIAKSNTTKIQEQHMTCRHNWTPLDLHSDNPNRYRYRCTRCGNIISAILKEKT